MREKRLSLCVFALALCLMLAMPLLATTNNTTPAMDTIDKAYPTEDGEPIFTLHLVTVANNAVAQLRTEYFAQGLRDIGIEPVIHILPNFFDILKPGQPPGEPIPIEIPLTSLWHQTTYDSKGVMWCGGDDPEWETPPGYPNNRDESLTKTFLLPAGASMSYSIRHDIEPEYDFVHIEISTDDSVTWTALATYNGVSDTNGDGRADFFDSQIDLSQYGGETVQLRFRFHSDVAWSDEDGDYDSDFGACHIDWVEVTGNGRDDFETGMDVWEATEPLPLVRYVGWDIFVYAVNFNSGVYNPDGLLLGSGEDEAYHGYCNPEYDMLYYELHSLGIDWNANFPDPPDLDTDDGDHALDLLETIQEMWLEEQPIWILWNRVWAGGAGSGFPIAVPNHRNPHLANPLVRQAINNAIPRQEMMEETGSPWATLTVVQTPFAPPHPGWDNKFIPEYNPSEGRELLKQAGYPIDEDGFIYADSQGLDSGPAIIATDVIRTVVSKDH